MGWEQEPFHRSLSSLAANTIAAYERDVAEFVTWAERARLDGRTTSTSCWPGARPTIPSTCATGRWSSSSTACS